MAWVAADKWNNEEYVFPDKPYKDEYNTWNCDGYIEGEIYNDCINLPKGTIKKLIGRDLTWEDEPVEI